MDGSRRMQAAHFRRALAAAALTIVAVAAPNAGSAASLRTLHSFCTQVGCRDGASPQSSLIMDGSGNLYGTSQGADLVLGGGLLGTVYRLAPPAGTERWTADSLYRFDGDVPLAGLLKVGTTLHGTASRGGRFGAGTAFAIKLR